MTATHLPAQELAASMIRQCDDDEAGLLALMKDRDKFDSFAWDVALSAHEVSGVDKDADYLAAVWSHVKAMTHDMFPSAGDERHYVSTMHRLKHEAVEYEPSSPVEAVEMTVIIDALNNLAIQIDAGFTPWVYHS